MSSKEIYMPQTTISSESPSISLKMLQQKKILEPQLNKLDLQIDDLDEGFHRIEVGGYSSYLRCCIHRSKI